MLFGANVLSFRGHQRQFFMFCVNLHCIYIGIRHFNSMLNIMLAWSGFFSVVLLKAHRRLMLSLKVPFPALPCFLNGRQTADPYSLNVMFLLWPCCGGKRAQRGLQWLPWSRWMETNEIAHCFLMYSRTTEMYLGSHYSGAVCERSSAELSTQMFSAGNAACSWEESLCLHCNWISVYGMLNFRLCRL